MNQHQNEEDPQQERYNCLPGVVRLAGSLPLSLSPTRAVEEGRVQNATRSGQLECINAGLAPLFVLLRDVEAHKWPPRLGKVAP